MNNAGASSVDEQCDSECNGMRCEKRRGHRDAQHVADEGALYGNLAGEAAWYDDVTDEEMKAACGVSPDDMFLLPPNPEQFFRKIDGIVHFAGTKEDAKTMAVLRG